MATYRKHLAYRTHKLYRSLGYGVFCTGWVDETFGTATVHGRAHVLPAGIAPTSTVYHPYVAFYYQFIFETGSWQDDHFGNTTAQLKTRFLYPTGWFEEHVGSGTAIRYHLQPAPLGWLDEQVPRAHVDIHFNNIRLAGWTDDRVSVYATIQWKRRALSFFGQVDERFGTLGIVNKNRFVYEHPQGYPDDKVSPNTSVINRNRILHPAPWQDDRFDFFDGAIRNNGRALLEHGWKDEKFGAGTFIAYKNRPLPLHGWVDESFGNSVPANLAWGVYPPSIGIDERFGFPRIVNTRRFLHLFGIPSTDAVGHPFVSFRIRYVVQSAGAHPDESFGFNTEVRYNPYPVHPISWVDSDRKFGWPAVYIHSHNLFPHTIASADVFGVPHVINRNRTVFVPSPDLREAFGTTHVELRTRHLLPAGLAPGVFGSHLVQWSTRYVFPSHFSVPAISTYHRVSESVVVGPPEDQFVYPTSWDDSQAHYGSHTVRIHGIFASGWFDEHMGTVVIRNNTINLQKHSIVNLKQVGTPTLIYTRGIFPPSIPTEPGQGDSDQFTQFTLPRVDPFHIYAPAGELTPVGYHPGPSGHHMDELLPAGYLFSRWPWFGQTGVANQNRSVHVPPVDDGGTVSPFASVDWKTHYVYPSGIHQWRIGLVRFLNVPQYVNLNTYHLGFAEESFGAAAVGPVPDHDRAIAPASMLTEVFGGTVVDWKNRARNIPSVGLDENFGVAIFGTTRYYALTGWLDENLIWTTEFVSYKIRHLGPTGFIDDSFERVDDDPIWFGQRMRVSHRGYVVHDKGFESTKFGAVVVKGGHECCNSLP
jgi:hypothetical protein